MGTTLDGGVGRLADTRRTDRPAIHRRLGRHDRSRPRGARRSDEDARIERGEELAQQGWQLWQERKTAARRPPNSRKPLNSMPRTPTPGTASAGRGSTAATSKRPCRGVREMRRARAGASGRPQRTWAGVLELGRVRESREVSREGGPQGDRRALWPGSLVFAHGRLRKARVPGPAEHLREQPGDETLKAMLAARARRNCRTS